MARLDSSIRLKASTLVEVITAMVILMVVFGIGMLVFANLFRSSTSLDHLFIQKQLFAVKASYLESNVQDEPIIMDSIAYRIVEEEIASFPDRVKIKIYAERIYDAKILDSLVSICEVINKTDE